MGFWAKLCTKIVQVIAAGIIAMGLEKGFDQIGNDDEEKNFSELRRDIAYEIKRLLSNEVELRNAMHDLKVYTFSAIAVIVIVSIILAAVKMYAKVIVKRATKKSIKVVSE